MAERITVVTLASGWSIRYSVPRLTALTSMPVLPNVLYCIWLFSFLV